VGVSLPKQPNSGQKKRFYDSAGNFLVKPILFCTAPKGVPRRAHLFGGLRTTVPACRGVLAACKMILAAGKTVLAACGMILAAGKTILAACGTILAAGKAVLAACSCVGQVRFYRADESKMSGNKKTLPDLYPTYPAIFQALACRGLGSRASKTAFPSRSLGTSTDFGGG
jgi:hypothetical protein